MRYSGTSHVDRVAAGHARAHGHPLHVLEEVRDDRVAPRRGDRARRADRRRSPRSTPTTRAARPTSCRRPGVEASAAAISRARRRSSPSCERRRDAAVEQLQTITGLRHRQARQHLLPVPERHRRDGRIGIHRRQPSSPTRRCAPPACRSARAATSAGRCPARPQQYVRFAYSGISVDDIRRGPRQATGMDRGRLMAPTADRRRRTNPRSRSRRACDRTATCGAGSTTSRSRSTSCTNASPDADAVLTLLTTKVDAGFLDAAGPQLKVVVQRRRRLTTTSTSPHARGRGVIATNTPGVLTDATADIAMALILMVTRRLGEGERIVRSGRAVAVGDVHAARHGHPGPPPRHRRDGRHRPGAGAPGAGLRHDGRRTPTARAVAPEIEAQLDADRLELDDCWRPPTSCRSTARTRRDPSPDRRRSSSS